VGASGNGGDIIATDTVPASGGGGGGSDSGGPTQSCGSWDPVTVLGNGVEIRGGHRHIWIDASWFRTSLSTGVFEQYMQRTCTPGGTVTGWVPITDPDPRISIPETLVEVRRRVPAPAPDLSPTTRGVVNLGMWLAVQEPAESPVTARASAAPGSWAETSATLQTTTFDLGNGDLVVCDGVGDPIPDSAKESIEPSPTCGYTVRESGTLTITITSRWTVVSTTSNGDVVLQPDIVLSTTFDYRVIEIQTVGQSG
jgi:hypothetical protein